MPLFPRDSRALSSDLQLTWGDVRRLHSSGLLSFDPETAGALDESREAELRFLGTMLVCGCSSALQRRLLAGLRKPYCYDVARVFFAWHTGQWQLLPGEDNPEAAFFALLERLRNRQSFDVLLGIRDWLDEALDLARARQNMFSHLADDRPSRHSEARGPEAAGG